MAICEHTGQCETRQVACMHACMHVCTNSLHPGVVGVPRIINITPDSETIRAINSKRQSTNQIRPDLYSSTPLLSTSCTFALIAFLCRTTSQPIRSERNAESQHHTSSSSACSMLSVSSPNSFFSVALRESPGSTIPCRYGLLQLHMEQMSNQSSGI